MIHSLAPAASTEPLTHACPPQELFFLGDTLFLPQWVAAETMHSVLALGLALNPLVHTQLSPVAET